MAITTTKCRLGGRPRRQSQIRPDSRGRQTVDPAFIGNIGGDAIGCIAHGRNYTRNHHRFMMYVGYPDFPAMTSLKPKARLFVIADLSSDGRVELSGDHVHYLANVLRLKIGDEVILFNGRDGEWSAIIKELTKNWGGRRRR